MNLHVGTSGYSYKEWKGSFYPPDLPAGGMLRFYAERFGTVEINNTFYRAPTRSVLENWAAEVPSTFRFVLKAPQRITHIKRLKETEDPVSYFFDVAGALGERLGPILFQLPPNMKKDAARLADFLRQLPPGPRVAFEFRHESWFDDEVYELLRGRGAAMCIAEAEDGVEVPPVATAPWGYMRLRRPDYTDADLQSWLKKMHAQSWADAYVFFKHEDEGRGPAMAARLVKLAAE